MKTGHLFPCAAWALLLLLASCGEFGGGVSGTGDGSAPTNLTFSSSDAAHSTGVAARWRNLQRWLGIPAAHAFGVGSDAGGNTVDLTDFLISIREIKFKQDDETAADLDIGDVEFQGPFILDLLDSAAPLAQTLGEVEVPAGTYDGVRFVMHKADDLDPADPNFAKMFGRSVYIEGTVNRGSGAEAFVAWHDTGENFDLAGPNGFDVLPGQTGNDLIVDFKLQSLLDGFDFTGANLAQEISTDSANDPVNRDLADLLKDNIRAAADFGKDEDDDGAISEEEDVD